MYKLSTTKDLIIHQNENPWSSGVEESKLGCWNRGSCCSKGAIVELRCKVLGQKNCCFRELANNRKFLKERRLC